MNATCLGNIEPVKIVNEGIWIWSTIIWWQQSVKYTCSLHDRQIDSYGIIIIYIWNIIANTEGNLSNIWLTESTLKLIS